MPTDQLILFWQWDAVLISSVLSLAVAYGLVVGPLRSRLAPKEALPRRHVLTFYAALVLLYLAEASPLHDLAERYYFSAHMAQHLIVSYIVAPLLLLAVPVWLWQLIFRGGLRRIAKVVLKPAVAFFSFSLFFSLWHIPAIYEGALRNSSLHHAEHLIFLAVSLILWWPLLNPLEDMPGLPYGLQLVYIFAIPVAQLPVFGIVTFADELFYPTYANSPAYLAGGAIADQAMGGVIMKVASLLVFGPVFITIFFRWFREESTPKRLKKTPQKASPG